MGKLAYNEKTGETLYLDESGEWKPAKTAENPQTGEKLVFDGSDWQPIPAQKDDRGMLESARDWERGISDSIVNTMTFGAGDYVKGFGQYLVDKIFSKEEKPDYRLAAKREREQFEQANPKTSFVASMVGSMANPVNTKLAQWATNAPKMAGLMGRGAVGSGLTTGLQTAGNSEGTLGERAEQTGAGAGLGFMLGGAIPPVVKGATNLIAGGGRMASDLIRKATGGNVHVTKAARKISEALERDQLTPQQAMKKIQELGPEARLIDVGPNTRALGFTVQATPGGGKKMLTDSLVKRQEGYRDAGQNLRGGQVSRIVKGIDKLVPENYYNIKDANEASRKFLGGFYEAAKRGDDVVDTSRLIKELDDEIYTSKGSIQLGLKKIRKLLHDPKGHAEIDVRSLHQAKMAIDDFMQGPSRSSIGNVAKARIREYQTKLVDAIESSGEAGKLYKTGRLGTAGTWRVDDAMDEGVRFLRGEAYRNPRDLKNYLSKLGAEEQEAFKVGAAKAIKDKLINLNVRQDAAKKVLDIPALEQKIKLAFGDEKTFQKYIRMVTNEKEMFKTYAKTFGGSETAERMAALEDATVDPGKFVQAFEDFKGGKYLRGAANILKGTKDAVFDPEPQSIEMAKQLLSRKAPMSVVSNYNLLQTGKKIDKNLMDYLLRSTPAVGGRLSQDLQNRR